MDSQEQQELFIKNLVYSEIMFFRDGIIGQSEGYIENEAREMADTIYQTIRYKYDLKRAKR